MIRAISFAAVAGRRRLRRQEAGSGTGSCSVSCTMPPGAKPCRICRFCCWVAGVFSLRSPRETSEARNDTGAAGYGGVATGWTGSARCARHVRFSVLKEAAAPKELRRTLEDVSRIPGTSRPAVLIVDPEDHPWNLPDGICDGIETERLASDAATQAARSIYAGDLLEESTTTGSSPNASACPRSMCTSPRPRRRDRSRTTTSGCRMLAADSWPPNHRRRGMNSPRHGDPYTSAIHASARAECRPICRKRARRSRSSRCP